MTSNQHLDLRMAALHKLYFESRGYLTAVFEPAQQGGATFVLSEFYPFPNSDFPYESVPGWSFLTNS